MEESQIHNPSEEDVGVSPVINSETCVFPAGCKTLAEMFYESLREKNMENIIFLVEQNSVDVNTVFEGPYISPEYRSWTALHIACKKGQNTFVTKLLQIGADPKIADKKGETPLHIVCKHGHNKCAEILLDFDPTLKDIQNKQGLTPLCKALYRLETPFKEKQYYKTIDLLIQARCDVNLSPVTNMTPLHLVAQKWCNSTVVMKLIKAGANVNAETADSSPLMSALCRQRVDKATVTHLIDAGANVNYKNPNGKSVLHVAVAKSEDICVKQLLAAGADANAIDADGNSPLWIAVCENNITITPLLLAYGGDVNFVSRDKHMSLLCKAASNGNKRIARLLLAQNVDVDTKSTMGESALHYAVLNCDIEMVKLLLRKNCELDHYLMIPNVWEEQNAFDIAMGTCDEKIMKLLLRVGFPTNKIPLDSIQTDLKDSKDLVNWILAFVHTPRPLIHICRVFLRKFYGKDIVQIVETLLKEKTIPKALAVAILMEDLLDDC